MDYVKYLESTKYGTLFCVLCAYLVPIICVLGLFLLFNCGFQNNFLY